MISESSNKELYSYERQKFTSNHTKSVKSNLLRYEQKLHNRNIESAGFETPQKFDYFGKVKKSE